MKKHKKKQNLFLEYDNRIMDGLPNVRQDIQYKLWNKEYHVLNL